MCRNVPYSALLYSPSQLSMPRDDLLYPARKAIREHLGQDGIPRAPILSADRSVRHLREPPKRPELLDALRHAFWEPGAVHEHHETEHRHTRRQGLHGFDVPVVLS